ncbi:MAG: hypothetical protein COA79_13350 [Planctomycetota bacterium]|nr:MAG: hypothetical protein COA79_13350 [Planctomycetota bacterium]
MLRKQFTLIEIMVSMMIMGFVMIIISKILITTLKNQHYVREQFTPTKSANQIMSLLLKEIKYAHKFYIIDQPISAAEVKTHTLRKNGQDTRSLTMHLFKGEMAELSGLVGSRLELYTATPLFDPRKNGFPEVSKVIYYLERYDSDGSEVSDRLNLMRSSCEAKMNYSERAVPQVALASSEIIGFSVYKGIRLLKIEYYNGLEWLPNWESSSENDVPRAARVDLVVNASKILSDSLPVIDYESYDKAIGLAKGDVRLQGMVWLVNSQLIKNKDEFVEKK